MSLRRRPRGEPHEHPRPARPALAAALGALTERDEAWWQGRFRKRGSIHGARSALSTRWHGMDVTHTVHWTVEGPAEAWEQLATRELIPVDWLADPRRGARRPRGEVVLAPGEPPSERPFDLALLAADVSGVLQAEAFARTFARCTNVVWDFRSEAQWRSAGLALIDDLDGCDLGSDAFDACAALGYVIDELLGAGEGRTVSIVAPVPDHYRPEDFTPRLHLPPWRP